jgi:peptidyl-prolyl cis-trans isomerase SurA
MPQPRFHRVCVVYVIGLLTASCGGSQPQPAASSSAAPEVWAVVDGREIKRNDVETAYRGSADPVPPQQSAEEALGLRLNILDELITQEVLVGRARTANLEATDAEVENAMAERRKAVTDDVFQQELQQRGLTVEDVKRGIKRELTVQKVLERDVTAKVAVTDQEVTEYYNQNRAQFNLAEPQYHLAQIAVTSVRDPQLRNRMNDDAGTPDEARRKVAMLMEKLKGGADFAALAMDYSEDPSTVGQGGNLGFIPASALDRVSPQLKQAVLKMQPGNVSTVSVGGNHTILVLVAHEPAGQRELSNPTVRDGIREMLKGRKQQLLHAAYVTSARDSATVVNHLARQIVEVDGKTPASAASLAAPSAAAPPAAGQTPPKP